MFEIFAFIFMLGVIAYIVLLFVKPFEIPKSYSQNAQEMVQPKITFLASELIWLPRPSGINPLVVRIYSDHILITSFGKHWIINKENFVEFKHANFLQPYTLKIKVDSIYKYEEIQFTMLSKKKAAYIEQFLLENKLINSK